jgi:hypothetical protein
MMSHTGIKLGCLMLMVLALAMGSSCGGNTSTGKGEESPDPDNNKSDSWNSPSFHGSLVFGEPNLAEFEGTKFYHAWNFILSGPASVSIWIASSVDNFDTVMYLYGRDMGTEEWGHYLQKNDDVEGNAWSRIDAILDAKEYRIVVKGFSSRNNLLGQFNVVATCSGEGCPSKQLCDVSLCCLLRQNSCDHHPKSGI